MNIVTTNLKDANCVVNGIATFDCFPTIIQNLVNIFFVAAVVVAFILILVSGVKFITSRGDKEAVASAQKTLTFAIIGLVFMIFAVVIIRILATIIGVPQLIGQ